MELREHKDSERYAIVCEQAFADLIRTYGLRRVQEGLTEFVPELAWANDRAFLAVMFDPRDAFCVYVGRLVDGSIPPYSAPPGTGFSWLAMDFVLEDAGLPLPPTEHVDPSNAQRLLTLLEPYAAHADVVAPVLRGDFAKFDELTERAESQVDDDD